jgi:membrane peptidoglycan carboxypeptidase/predicted nucleic acid-binding Zn ribbon protein
MVCPFCGKEHSSKTKYCTVTGQRLKTKRRKKSELVIVTLVSILILIVILVLILNRVDKQEPITIKVREVDTSTIDQAIPFSTLEIEEKNYLSRSTSFSVNQGEELPGLSFSLNNIPSAYPHWTNYIRSLLEAQYDHNTIYQSGLTIHSTLNTQLQDAAQEILRSHIDGLADRRVTNGALVAIRPSTGEILAMVGSADFNSEAISGQVNMAISPRQPGAAMKPITYAAAFEKGWTPSTLIWDVPVELPPSGDPNDPSPKYRPDNYDNRFRGPVLVRDALASSYNIPAVKALQFIGIYDNPQTPQPDGFINMAQRLGITTLTRNDYGLSLTLGGGDVSLLEMVSAYGVFANNGRRMPAYAIKRIEDNEGNTLYEQEFTESEQSLRSEHAYLINSILSDNDARAPMFGANSVLNLPFPVAAKTGTTNDFRDIWTIGYTPDLVVGVWVGNTDYSQMVNTGGLTGAAPIWSQFMQYAVPLVSGDQPTEFPPPEGIKEQIICALSGTDPSDWCYMRRNEIFAFDQGPQQKNDDLWQVVKIDTWTGLGASSYCDNFTRDVLMLNVTDESAKEWITNTDQGQAWAASIGFKPPIPFIPDRECKQGDPRPILDFVSLKDGGVYHTNLLPVHVIANADGFAHFRFEYGMGDPPISWIQLMEGDRPIYQAEEIYQLDLNSLPGDIVTLRLFMENNEGTYAEKRLLLEIDRK